MYLKLIAPSLISLTGIWVASTSVEGSPPLQIPASKMRSNLFPRLSSTCSAVLAGFSPLMFALGAVRGWLRLDNNFLVIEFPGCRIPIRPFVRFSGMVGLGLKRMVSGPGQKVSMSLVQSSEGSSTRSSSFAGESIKRSSGFFEPRFLIL